MLDRPIAFHRIFVEWTGSVNAALMLSQLVYWTKRTKDSEGWIYKSAIEWEEETGLSTREQATARKVLRLSGLVEEKLKGLPAILHFRICKTSFDKSAKLVSTKAQNKSSLLRRDSYKEYKHTPRGGGCIFPEEGESLQTKKSVAAKIVEEYANWNIKNRLHAGKQGSTRSGWSEKTITQWIVRCRLLLKQLDGDKQQVRKVLRWYFEHWKEEYSKRCNTFSSFCDKFVEIEMQMKKGSSEQIDYKVPEYDSVVDGKEIKDFDVNNPKTWR